MGLLSDVATMHHRHPSPWPVAWSRVLTARSARIRRYLHATPAQRRGEYPWLYRERTRKR